MTYVNILVSIRYNLNMNASQSRPYHHGNLKASAIETALDMVEQEGLDSITLRELSRRIGASRTAIYRHFENKEALLRAVVEAGFERFDTYFIVIFGRTDLDVLQRFSLMGRAYIDFATGSPNLFRLLFGETVQQARQEVCDLENREINTGFNALVQMLEEGQRQGVFKPGDVFLMAVNVWSMIHGLAMLIIDGHIVVSDNVEAIFDAGNKALLQGLCAQ